MDIIGLLITVVIIGLIAWVIWWAGNAILARLAPPEPIATIIYVLIILCIAILCIYALSMFLPAGSGLRIR